MGYSNTINLINQAVVFSAQPTARYINRVKPAVLATNLLSITQRAGTVYLEDVKAAFDRLPEVTHRQYAGEGRQVKWESVLTALRVEARLRSIDLHVVNNDFIYIGER